MDDQVDVIMMGGKREKHVAFCESITSDEIGIGLEVGSNRIRPTICYKLKLGST